MTKQIQCTEFANVVGIGLESLIAILVAELPEGATDLTLVCYRHADDKRDVQIQSLKTPKGSMVVEYVTAKNLDEVGMFCIKYVLYEEDETTDSCEGKVVDRLTISPKFNQSEIAQFLLDLGWK